MMLGDPQAMRATLAAHLQDDEALLNFLASFVRRLRRRVVTERAVRVTLQVDPNDLADYLNVEEVGARVEALLANAELTSQRREELEGCVHGKKTRDACGNPLDWRSREVDDD